MHDFEVNGLPLPPLLVELLAEGRWQHPGDDLLREWIPFLREPVVFITTVEGMRQVAVGVYSWADPQFERTFHLARGSQRVEPVNLPWLDLERFVPLAVNQLPGDDLAIVLDYRTGAADPRVVASDWHHGPGECLWREVAPTFSRFVAMLGT